MITAFILAASLYGAPFLHVNAWTPHASPTRYPAVGTYDVSEWSYVRGNIGLDPAGPWSAGVLTFVWTWDEDGEWVAGIEAMHLTSLIVSQNEPHLETRGPHLFLIYAPFFGPNALAASLAGSNAQSRFRELPGDTILVDEKDKILPPNGTATIYPCDYFAGEGLLWLSSSPGVVAWVYGFDLTNQNWPLVSTGSGSVKAVLPMGSWFVFVYNTNQQESAPYSVSVTPLMVTPPKP